MQELKKFWEGETLNIIHFNEPKLIRGAFLCVASDMPASKKVAGFIGHSANHGCSKFMKVFPRPGPVSNKDYSGFNRSSWNLRTHMSCVRRIQWCPNKTQCQSLESEYGCRYSELLELTYFDPVKMTVVDPMHNLFLGSAKHVMKDMWMDNNVLASY